MNESPGEESFFDFKCPYCGELNSFPAVCIGTLQECAMCGEALIVPEEGAAVARKLPLPFSSQRLVLRRFRADDAAAMVALAQADEKCTLLVTDSNIDEWIEQQRVGRFTRSQQGVCLAIELAQGGKLAGFVWLYYMDAERHSAGFSVTIATDLRRQGMGLEAMRATMDLAFDGLCAQRVSVSCPSQNAASRGMVEKAGLRREGEFVKSWFDGNAWVNVMWYALLKEERTRA